MRWGSVVRLLLAVLGGAVLVGSGASAPLAGAAALTAGLPSGSCGPALQPCTWNFAQAAVYPAQPRGREGAGVLVAVVDTWVDLNHPDFQGRVVDEADCLSGTCQDHAYHPDQCQHGTHVAGTIASASYGVAPRADILAVQALSYDSQNGDCSGTTTAVGAGIRFAADHGARIINLSLGDLVPGVTQSSEVTSAVDYAASRGVLVVFAAGNSTIPVTDNYGPDALLVAATGPTGQLAVYSQRYGSVSIAAPGGDDGADGLGSCGAANCIASTWPDGQYGLMEGTSMAAPHVSGTAALLFAENPRRSTADVVHALEATAKPLAGAGHGLLDAGAALALEPGAAVPTTASPPPAAPSAPQGRGGSTPGSVAPNASGGGGVPAAAAPSTAASSAAAPRHAPAAASRRAKRGSTVRLREQGAAPVVGEKAHTGGSSVAAAGAVAVVLLLLVAGLGGAVFRRRGGLGLRR